MKKLLLTLLLLFTLGLAAQATTEELTLSSSTIANNGKGTFCNGDITLTFDTSNASFSQSNHIRVYGGKTFTIAGADGVTISEIVIESTTASYYKKLSANVGTMDNATKTWTGSSNIVELTNTESAQARLTKLTITYEKGAVGPKEPVDFTAFDKLVEDGVALYIGKTQTIALPENTPEISYSNTNPAAATIENGVITALAVGETEITASWNAVPETWNSGEKTFKVTVSEAPDTDVVTFDFTTSGNIATLTNKTIGSTIDGTTITNGMVSIVTTKGGNNATLWHSNGEIRLYKNNTLKVSAEEGYYIVSATFIGATGNDNWGNLATGSVTGSWNTTESYADDHIWTAEGQPTEVTFDASGNRCYFEKLNVEYAKLPPTLDGEPTINVTHASKKGVLIVEYSFNIANHNGKPVAVTATIDGKEHIAFVDATPANAPARVAGESTAVSGTLRAEHADLVDASNLNVNLKATLDGKEFFTRQATVNTTTGIEDVTVEGEGEAEYFNLQGLRVAQPEAGQLYIKRQAGKAVKVRF